MVIFLALISFGCTERSTTPAKTTLTATPVEESADSPALSPQASIRPAVAFPTPPDRELYDLTQRLRLKGDERVPRLNLAETVEQRVGDKDRFWVIDLDNRKASQIEAKLQLVSPHAYWYVEEGVKVSTDSLNKAAKFYEEEIYPKVTSVYYPEEASSVKRPRLSVLHARIQGAAGYFGGADAYPQAVHQYSNERYIIYINVDALDVGTRPYLAVLAHEFQHALHSLVDSSEDTWVNEGLSELASELLGFGGSFQRRFLERPSISLTEWPEEPKETAPYYGASHLFFRYLAQRYGGTGSLRYLVGEPQDNIQGIDAYLAQLGYSERFEDVLKRWVVANYL
ncbi:MAG: hypothetical protein HYY31_05765, partial [Chloroflexi bacterium]|nr:hypothetical protein [Chloroflexota bacterium]